MTALLWAVLAVHSQAAALVTLHGANLDVKDVLTALGAIGGVNLVVDEAVVGKVSLNMTEVPFETALEIVTKSQGLAYQNVGSVIVVGPAEKLGRAFGGVTVFKIKYAKAGEVAKLLQVVGKSTETAAVQEEKGTEKSAQNGGKESAAPGKKGKAESGKEGAKATSRIEVDEYNNFIVFKGSPEEAAQAHAIVEQVDLPYQQVSLEAEIVALNKQASKALGVEWEWSKSTQYPEYQAAKYTVTQDAAGHPIATQTDSEKYTRDKANMSGTIRYGRSPGGYPYEFYFNSTIKALFANGDAKVLAKPKVMTINGQTALINIGDRVPVPVTTTTNNVTTSAVEYQECGIILQYQPRINADGHIVATVHTEVSSPSLVPELKAYKFTKRSADTEVRLKDGETLVIGGLIGKEEMKAMTKVPFLSDIPILGAFFKSTSHANNESELVIFLTARIVKE